MTNARATLPGRDRRVLWISIVLLAVVAAPGCHRVPLRFPDATPTPDEGARDRGSFPRPTLSRLDATTEVSEDEVIVPALAAGAPSHKDGAGKSPGQAGGFVSAHSPTPHLDAAYSRKQSATPKQDGERLSQQPDRRSSEPKEPASGASETSTALAPPLDLAATPIPIDLSPPLPAEPSPLPLDLSQVGPVETKTDDKVVSSALPPSPRSELEPGSAPTPDGAAAVPRSTQPPNAEHRDGAARAKPPTWEDQLESLINLSREEAARTPSHSAGWKLRSRVLEALRGHAPGEAEIELWRGLLELVEVSRTEPPDESAIATRLAEAIESLESLTPFQIPAVNLCRRVQGFGNFDSLDASALKAGQVVIVYCELRGLSYRGTDEGYRSRVATKVSLVSREGDREVWSKTLDTAEDLCRSRRRDYYVNYRVKLPQDLAPGAYSLRIQATDLLSERETETSIRLTVVR